MSYFIRVKVMGTEEYIDQWNDLFLEYTSKDPESDEDARLQKDGSHWILAFKISNPDGTLVQFESEEVAQEAAKRLQSHLPRAFYQVQEYRYG